SASGSAARREEVSTMKRIASLLVITLLVSPVGASLADASHRSHRHYDHDHFDLGDAIATLLVAGLVVAAIGDDSHDYSDSSWGVIDTHIQPNDAMVFIDGAAVGK